MTSLTSIEAALHRLGRQALLRALQAGVSATALRTALESAGLGSAPELEALYAWRNGTSTTCGVTLDDIHIFPGFYLLSIEDAIANYKAFSTDPRWRPDWLPVFANGGGDFYAVELGSLTARPVHHFRIEESQHPLKFTSISAMLAAIAVAFERGVFFVDSNGYLEMDDFYSTRQLRN